MLNWIITGIIGAVALVGSFFPKSTVWDSALNLGATNFPTSLDSLTNPSGTDSVATVSHSGQHSNANDAIEALEAKLGITASTPLVNRLLYADGTGSSLWSANATVTALTATNLMATGSSTLQTFSYVNATGTLATTTHATTTTLFATTASTTNTYGGGLYTCSGTTFLQWSGGRFSCGTPTTGTVPTATELLLQPNYRSITAGIITTYTYSNTSMSCGQQIVPADITVGRISINVQDVANRGGTAGQFKFAMYSQSGQTQKFATTTFISTTGIKTFALDTPTAVGQGIYYVCVVPVGTADADLSSWVNTNYTTFDTLTGYPFLAGTTTVTAGTLPATFDPTAMGSVQSTGLIIRLDD